MLARVITVLEKSKKMRRLVWSSELKGVRERLNVAELDLKAEGLKTVGLEKSELEKAGLEKRGG